MPISTFAASIHRPATWLGDVVARTTTLYFEPVDLPRDRYGPRFWGLVSLMFITTVVTYWLLVWY
jgi:hypothetical protein